MSAEFTEWLVRRYIEERDKRDEWVEMTTGHITELNNLTIERLEGELAGVHARLAEVNLKMGEMRNEHRDERRKWAAEYIKLSGVKVLNDGHEEELIQKDDQTEENMKL